MKTRVRESKQSLPTLPGLNSSSKAFIYPELPLGVSTYLDLFVLYSPSIKWGLVNAKKELCNILKSVRFFNHMNHKFLSTTAQISSLLLPM